MPLDFVLIDGWEFPIRVPHVPAGELAAPLVAPRLPGPPDPGRSSPERPA